MKTGIYYASTTGTTEELARMIAKDMKVADADIHDVAKTAPSTMGDYDLIVIGSSTYGSGDLQDDMADFIDGAQILDLKGKRVAVFGAGDESMTDTFCDAVGIIYDKLKDTGAEMVGTFPTYPYEFDHSKAVPVQGAEAEGLLIDNVNHADLTADRVAKWVEKITK